MAEGRSSDFVLESHLVTVNTIDKSTNHFGSIANTVKLFGF